MDGGRLRRPRLLGIYSISKMQTNAKQKMQELSIKAYEKDVKIYKDIENSQGQGAFFLKTPVKKNYKTWDKNIDLLAKKLFS